LESTLPLRRAIKKDEKRRENVSKRRGRRSAREREREERLFFSDFLSLSLFCGVLDPHKSRASDFSDYWERE